MDKELEKLRKEYKDVPIPVELDDIVAKTLQKKKRRKRNYIWPTSISAAALILTATVNFSPDAAYAMSKIPIVKGIVDVITFNKIEEEVDHNSINVKTPSITGLENKKLEQDLNQKYVKESKELYKEFSNASSKKDHFSIDSDYKKVTETPTILSIQRTIERINASGYTQNQYINIDKENQLLITLKSLFKDDSYINLISENIIEQMKEQMKADPNKIYWIRDEDLEPFTHIDPNQQFYINKNNKLVIAFDEYDVTPGYMGTVEFEIPTEAISSILVGDRYIH